LNLVIDEEDAAWRLTGEIQVAGDDFQDPGRIRAEIFLHRDGSISVTQAGNNDTLRFERLKPKKSEFSIDY